MVHCETSTGVFHSVEAVGKLVKKHAPGASFFVDAMSSFGAVPLNLDLANIDFLVSSANKCIEGVPGFSFVLGKIESLMRCKGWARSHCLDIVDQYEGLEKNGQFRFTPATHVMLAFRKALSVFKAEGGVTGRANRLAILHNYHNILFIYLFILLLLLFLLIIIIMFVLDVICHIEVD